MRALLLFILIWKQDLVWCVRLLDLRVPAHAAEGGEALLGCQFDMEDDHLYSVKWYKDAREFYRYVPKNEPPVTYFPMPGVTVDTSRSSSNVVALMELTKDSAGQYRCEVSGEAPSFTTVYDQKYITIHLLPENGPRITGLQKHYEVGDRVVVNCTSLGSKPEAQLKWLLNERPVPKHHLQGPWYRLSAERPDTIETILQLRFTVKRMHLIQDMLTFKCQATIAPLYQQEVALTVRRSIVHTSTLQTIDEGQVLNFPDFIHNAQTDETTEEPNFDNSSNYAAKIHDLQFVMILYAFLIQVFV